MYICFWGNLCISALGAAFVYLLQDHSLCICFRDSLYVSFTSHDRYMRYFASQIYYFSHLHAVKYSSGFYCVYHPGICVASSSLGTAEDSIVFVLPEYALSLAVQAQRCTFLHLFSLDCPDLWRTIAGNLSSVPNQLIMAIILGVQLLGIYLLCLFCYKKKKFLENKYRKPVSCT